MLTRKLYAVGANIFAGGFTLGVSKHFTVLAHLEHSDRYGASVAAANFPGLQVYAPDDDARVLDAWPSKFAHPIDFVYANPPCAVWSVAGNNARQHKDWRLDPRLQRVRDVFTLVKRYHPRIWAFESVCGAFTKGREFIDELVRDAAAQGYGATFVFIDAQWHGLAQTRRRFFLVLHRVAIDWRAPNYDKPLLDASEVIKNATPITTMKCSTAVKALLSATPPGGKLRNTYFKLNGDDGPRNSRGQRIGCVSFHDQRLKERGPSGAITSGWFYPPRGQRRLSAEEIGLLCGFPVNYNWPGAASGFDQRCRLMARGVMPPVGEWLAANVARAIRTDKHVKAPTTTYADFRTPPGVVAPAAEVEALRVKAPRAKSERVALPHAPRVKAPPLDYAALAKAAPPAPRDAPTTTSGEFIRHVLRLGRYPDALIAAMVRATFPARKTTVADVAWNRGRLRKAGVVAPRMPFLRNARETVKAQPSATRSTGRHRNVPVASAASRSVRPRERRRGVRASPGPSNQPSTAKGA